MFGEKAVTTCLCVISKLARPDWTSLRCDQSHPDCGRPRLSFVFASPAGWSFQMGSAYQFHSWRVFVLVCAFPCVAAIAALSAMPESPRFYLEVWRRSTDKTFFSRPINCIAILRFNLFDPSINLSVYLSLRSQNGKHDEGWMILKQVHDTNMRAKGYPERVFSVSDSNCPCRRERHKMSDAVKKRERGKKAAKIAS